MVVKTIENKEIICFVWLYLCIVICEFRLILLDCITNVVFIFFMEPTLTKHISNSWKEAESCHYYEVAWLAQEPIPILNGFLIFVENFKCKKSALLLLPNILNCSHCFKGLNKNSERHPVCSSLICDYSINFQLLINFIE